MKYPLLYSFGVVWASGLLRNFLGLLSYYQVLVSNQEKLEISSSTPSWFLVSTGQTRKFPYYSWFDLHLVVCSRGGMECPIFRYFLVIVCVVLVANNFTELDSGPADFGYLAFGELSRFGYCLLQKVRQSSDLPVIEKWEAYMLPNHACFGAIAEEHFLEGTRLLPSLEKINSNFLRQKFR